VILAEAALDPSNPNAVRASMGTLFTVPVISCTTAQALTRLRELEVDVVTAALEAQDLYTAVDLRGPVALVLGPERDTPSPAWQRAGRRVRIPLRGAADSLNVSVAAAILMFEAVRQRAQP
jgi:TrmH family RNA methyltransferase